MPKITPTPSQDEIKAKKNELLEMFERMLPVVDGMADSIRFAALLGVGLIVWLFVWLFFLKAFSLTTALIVAGITFLPILLLLRFWWALEELKSLPEIIAEMVDDAKEEVTETVNNIRSGGKQKFGLFSSVKSLWQVGSFAGEARELLGAYVSIGTLLNPFSLILGVLSLLFVLLLIFVGIVLVFLSF